MDYKHFNITKTERDEEARDVRMLLPYILHIKKQQLGSIDCERCGSNKDTEIHHKRYGSDVAIKDLEILCYNCHKLEHKQRKNLDFSQLCPTKN